MRTVIGGKDQGGGLFTGILDEIAIYGTALSAERIAAHHGAATR